MESLSSKRKVIESKPLNFLERAYLPAIFSGLATTMKHFFRKPVTISFPEERREFSENFRGMHSLKRDENGKERCTACGLCA
ncbi:MAG TPA: NADH-quinone oxidoreductase subunit I, partial [Mucilaginibacter sp.]